jgi:hypothetical protein
MATHWAQKLLLVDRRIIFLLVFLGAIIPIIRPIGLAVQVSPPVQAIFDRIEEMNAGDVIILSFDYGPSDGPELDPMANSIMRHCYKRGIKIVGVSLFPLGGVEMAIARTRQLTVDLGAQDHVDWVNLGYKDGGQAAMKAMGEDIASVFPEDASGVPTGEIAMMERIRNYNNAELAISLATSVLGEWWINLVNAQFGIDVAVGTTAVSAPKYYAYVEAQQAIGVIGGMKGASEYEELVERAYPDLQGLSRSATMGMDVQSIVHVIIIFFILFGNAMYIATRRLEKETR